jgi:hypothetical protein
LKNLLPDGTRGLWNVHANVHAGHIRCAEAAQHCDIVAGILFNNMPEGERWMTGTTYLHDYPLTQSDISSMQKYSDVVLILKDDYHPYKDCWDEIKNEFDENFPIECLKEKGILEDQMTFNALLYAVAFRYVLHGIHDIHFDYQPAGGKDRYRSIGYMDYLFERWGIKIDLMDSVRDVFGNSISKTIGGLPKHLKDRINKPLLREGFECIKDAQSNIESIEGLSVTNFYRMNGWIHATFVFDGYKPWTEGIRCK